MLILKGGFWQWRIIWLGWLTYWLLEQMKILIKDTKMKVEDLNYHLHQTKEAKVDIPTFGGEVDADKLNHWLKNLEVYLQIQGVVNDVEKIYFAKLNMGRHALVW